MLYGLVEMSGWDMGIYTQALHSGVTGHLFYSALIPGSYLSEHFSPMLFLLVIPYYLFPSAYTLLIIQGLAIGFSGLLLFLLSKNILVKAKIKENKRWLNPGFISIVIATAYLMSPLTESPIFFDFHLMVLLPLFFFAALYSFIKKKFILNIVFLALIVSLHSNFVWIVLMTILMELLLNRKLKVFQEKRPLVEFSLFAVSAFILVGYYITAEVIKGNISGVDSITPHIHVTGSVGPISLLMDMFTKPHFVLTLLASHYQLKLTLLLFGFGGTAFLFTRYPPAILPMTPYLFYSMFSTYASYYAIGYQYTMMFIPMLAFGSIMGVYILMEKSRVKPHYKKHIRAAIIVIVAIALIGFSVATPLVSGDAFSNNMAQSGMQYTNSTYMKQVSFEHKVAASIGEKSSVVTENGLFTLFGNDPNATAFPFTSDVVVNGSYYQFLVENTHSMWSSNNATIDGKNVSLNYMEQRYQSSGDYGIYARGYGIIVLEKGYTGTPKFSA
jgi:uncharacterized membrane protein